MAIFLRSPQLATLREMLASEWEPWLIDQDRAGFRPHVTIQNNVPDQMARKTLREIAVTFRVPPIRGIGLHLWRYRDGPWEDARALPLRLRLSAPKSDPVPPRVSHAARAGR